MKTAVTANSDYAEASFKDADGQEVSTSWSELDADVVVKGRPWRNFPWYLGQRNYSGRYWCATERRLVGYESRLELSRLMMVDFDRSSRSVARQPFWLRAKVAGERLRRVPDYLVCTDQGPLVIDVTRAKKMSDPEFRRRLDLTRQVIESRGWRYEVVHEPPRVEFLNIRFLAGYRRPWLFRPDVLDSIRDSSKQVDQHSVGEIIAGTEHSRPIALAAVMHLLWLQEFTFDVTKRLSLSTIVEVST
jgi:hypothetical protein